MRARHELHKLAAGGRLYNWGGDDDNSNTTTTQNYDQRQVNTTDVSSYDLSDHSTTTTNADFSNRSTNNTSVINTTTDGGAVAGALAMADGALKSVTAGVSSALGFARSVADGQNATTVHAYDFADNVFHGALDAVQANDTRALDAFSRAATIQNDALAMSKNGFSSAMSMVQNAYADAKGTTQAQQKIMMGVLVVAAVAVLAPRLGK